MSNNNDNQEISSNVPSNTGPSGSVEPSINNPTKNLENIDTNKTSTKTFKVTVIEGPRETQNNVVINQANTAGVSEEPHQNAEASSSNSFNPDTSEIIESIVNFSTDENCTNIVIPQAVDLFNNQTNNGNDDNISEASGNVNEDTKNQTELPVQFQPLQTSNVTTDRLAEDNIPQANQGAASIPQQSNEAQASIATTPDLESHHNDEGTDKNVKNVTITQAMINESLSNQLKNVNNTTTRIPNISTPRTIGSNESISELQVTTSIYLSNTPSGLPYRPSQTEPQYTELRHHRQERVRHSAASISHQFNASPRSSARNCSFSAANLTAHQNVVPKRSAERCDRNLGCVLEPDNIGVNITALPIPPLVIQGPPPIAGAPPTYSAVMRLGPEEPRHLWTQSIRIQPSPPFIAPIPPPPYTEIQGMHTDRPMLVASADQMIWGPDPISVVCPRCANVVVTSTQSQRSNLTHFSALALCLCGCWPCCLLPYCMDSCKNTYHHCPTCQQFLGMYRPW